VHGKEKGVLAQGAGSSKDTPYDPEQVTKLPNSLQRSNNTLQGWGEFHSSQFSIQKLGGVCVCGGGGAGTRIERAQHSCQGVMLTCSKVCRCVPTAG
jgi:hypothetical protein